MQISFEWRTTPSAVVKKHDTGQSAAHGASVQCMQAIDTERSPGWPSLMVPTLRRVVAHGTSFLFLDAVTDAIQSNHRSASPTKFMPSLVSALLSPNLANVCLR